MRLSWRRLGIAVAAFVEATLILSLVGGFLRAGLLAGLVTIVLGGLIYRDIARRDSPRSSDIREP